VGFGEGRSPRFRDAEFYVPMEIVTIPVEFNGVLVTAR
jgi:hypothetical protein